jgi:hypothetical protein
MENYCKLPLFLILLHIISIVCIIYIRAFRPKQPSRSIDIHTKSSNSSGWDSDLCHLSHSGGERKDKRTDPYIYPYPYPYPSPERIGTTSSSSGSCEDTMDPVAPIREPYTLDLGHRGFIQGVSILKEKDSSPLCRYFGGLRYALPPTRRWGKSRPLPRNFSYGTRESPGRYDGQAKVCPQPDASWGDPAAGLDEDCFQCNVWVPVGEKPDGGRSYYMMNNRTVLFT